MNYVVWAVAAKTVFACGFCIWACGIYIGYHKNDLDRGDGNRYRWWALFIMGSLFWMMMTLWVFGRDILEQFWGI